METNKEINLEFVFNAILKEYNINVNTETILMSMRFVDICGYKQVIDDANKYMKQYPSYRKVIKQQMDRATDKQNIQFNLSPNYRFVEYCKLVLLMRDIRIISRKNHKR